MGGSTLYEKVEQILRFWKDQKNRAIEDRHAFIQFLAKKQNAKSCEHLILRLKAPSAETKGFSSYDAPFEEAADPISARWSVALAVYNYCKLQSKIEIDINYLKEELDKTARSYKHDNFFGFHPLDFDCCIVRGVPDKDRKYICTLKIKVKEMKWEKEKIMNDSDSSDDGEGSEFNGVLLG